MSSDQEMRKPVASNQHDSTTEPIDTTSMLLKYVQERDVDCPQCEYNVRNLIKPICPECNKKLTLSVGIVLDLFGWISAFFGLALFLRRLEFMRFDLPIQRQDAFITWSIHVGAFVILILIAI